MTSKEKAAELVEKYKMHAYTNVFSFRIESNLYHAIKCALIAVDEIIFALNDDIYIQGETDIDSHREYWQEVKEEINKL